MNEKIINIQKTSKNKLKNGSVEERKPEDRKLNILNNVPSECKKVFTLFDAVLHHVAHAMCPILELF